MLLTQHGWKQLKRRLRDVCKPKLYKQLTTDEHEFVWSTEAEEAAENMVDEGRVTGEITVPQLYTKSNNQEVIEIDIDWFEA